MNNNYLCTLAIKRAAYVLINKKLHRASAEHFLSLSLLIGLIVVYRVQHRVTLNFSLLMQLLFMTG